ncbi:MAG: glycosyltransferase [Spartobacteria bacterium]|nr:glycosyltransferase [Spartobacteria bacterium]
MADEAKKLISIVVPFLNERENIPVLYERVRAAFDSVEETFELVFVDDGSSDGSPDWAMQKATEDDRIKVIRLSRNFGHQIAITAGMDHARGDAVIIMDADLQDPPEVIPDLIAKWRLGKDVVYAVRESREGETVMKKFLAATFYKVFRHAANIDVPLNAGDFRLISRKAINALKQVRELHRFVRGLTCWVGFEQDSVVYKRAARLTGETKYPVWKSARLAWDGLTSFSGAPLRWITTFGIVVAFAGLLLTLHVVVSAFLGSENLEPGWATIVSLILFMGGVQLISLGLVGQYVSRTYEESKKRPLYFVKKMVGLPDQE